MIDHMWTETDEIPPGYKRQYIRSCEAYKCLVCQSFKLINPQMVTIYVNVYAPNSSNSTIRPPQCKESIYHLAHKYKEKSK
jgi:hypothetical protein